MSRPVRLVAGRGDRPRRGARGAARRPSLLTRLGDPDRRRSAPPRFVDETAASGLDHTYDGGTTSSIGGGVAVLDCDDDGRPDLYLAGGDHPAALFRNEQHGRRRAARSRASAVPSTDLTGVTGAYPLDIDGDGHVDLAVLRVGEPVLLRGPRRLPVRAGERGLGVRRARTRWTTAFSATWEGADALPDARRRDAT